VDTSTLIWIIVGIVVVIAIVVVVVLATARGRRASQLEAQRRKAAELRTTADDAGLAAREREAEALRADAEARQAQADAAQAQANAERLARESGERQQAAEKLRAESAEHLRKADEVDPDVTAERRPADARADGAAVADSQHVDAPVGDRVDEDYAPRHASANRTADATDAPAVPAQTTGRTTTDDSRDPRTGV